MSQQHIVSRNLPANPQIHTLMLALLLLLPLATHAADEPAAPDATTTYTNPVIPDIGLADPTVLRHNGLYYLYPTGDTRSYHVYTSLDLVHWKKGPKVFQPGLKGLWAPDVFYNQADKTFYLYYTADWNIGVATCDRPDGTFTDHGLLQEKVIDAHLFQGHDGTFYLAYTNLRNIFIHQMTDPLHLAPNRIVAVQPTEPWETAAGRVTEGPWVLQHDKKFYMLYSGSGANSKRYAIGYATAPHPLGPWTKYEGNPIISRHDNVFGPGHGATTTDDAGQLWHLYHQKLDDKVNYRRFICLDPMTFDENGVLHSRATRNTPQPAPFILPDPNCPSQPQAL